jgi:hypothetical protein
MPVFLALLFPFFLHVVLKRIFLDDLGSLSLLWFYLERFQGVEPEKGPHTPHPPSSSSS